MLVRRVYSEIIFYVLVPLFVVLAIFGVLIFFRSRMVKNETDQEKIYRINFWSAVIGIIFGAILEAVAFGFSVAFLEKFAQLQLEAEYPWFVVFLYAFPWIPFLFLVFVIYRFVRIIKEKSYDDQLRESSDDYEEQVIHSKRVR